MNVQKTNQSLASFCILPLKFNVQNKGKKVFISCQQQQQQQQ